LYLVTGVQTCALPISSRLSRDGIFFMLKNDNGQVLEREKGAIKDLYKFGKLVVWK
jgi:hypothetical protein